MVLRIERRRRGGFPKRCSEGLYVWVLSQGFAFEERLLADAIRSTFARRGTELEVTPACFGDTFAATPPKAAQWKGFLKTPQVNDAPAELPEVISRVQAFVSPVAKAIVAGGVPDRRWKPGGSWAVR